MPTSRLKIPMRRIGVFVLSLVVALTAETAPAVPVHAAPPDPPGKEATLDHLAGLTVAAEGSSDGYSRAKFPHWHTVSGTCDTRETVLRRDGVGVETNAACAAVSGSWYSPYDGAVWSLASDVDIDHMVPLAEAWRSGAGSWTTARRETFANDLASSQLWAVTDNVNQAKSDKDPARWLPPRIGFRCTYARSWTDVKYRYDLTVDQAEKTALRDLIGRYC